MVIAEEEKNVEEVADPVKSKPKSPWMDDTILIVFFGVIFLAIVGSISGNIYLGLATFTLTLIFWKKHFMAFPVDFFNLYFIKRFSFLGINAGLSIVDKQKLP